MAVDQRNFGNVIDINGTEVNMEDKRLAELAGQTPKSSSQISTSSQYVPLQDTDGNIVKISPASFQEAVRNTLASLLVNNDKGTSFSQVPVIGSGDFGSASLANLASVLGAADIISLGSTSTDANTLVGTAGTGFEQWYFGSAFTNVPNNKVRLIHVKAPNSAYNVQEAYTHDGEIYSRTRWGVTDNDWTSWSRNDNYGTTSLAELADAVGGLGNLSSGYVFSGNIDELLSNKCVAITSNNTQGTLPKGQIYGTLVCFCGGYFSFQLIVEQTDEMYFRFYHHDSWGTWKKVSVA
jgi:hypothetical protein